MGKGAPTHILPGQADIMALCQQCAVGQDFCIAPVHRQGAGGHLVTIIQQPGNLLLRHKAIRHFIKAGRQLLQGAQIQAGVRCYVPFMANVGSPVNMQGGVGVFHHTVPGHRMAFIQRLAISLKPGFIVFSGQGAHGHEPVGIEAQGCGVLANLLIHDGLGDGRFVPLIVPPAAIAHHVNDHILVELHAIVQRQLGDEDHRLRVITIDMEDGRLDHLGNLSAVVGGAGVNLLTDGVAYLVVDDNVNGATCVKATGLRHLEGLHDHTLAGQGGIAMHIDGQHLAAPPVLAPVHSGPHRAFYHRGDNFQVRGVEAQRQVHFTPWGHDIG